MNSRSGSFRKQKLIETYNSKGRRPTLRSTASSSCIKIKIIQKTAYLPNFPSLLDESSLLYAHKPDASNEKRWRSFLQARTTLSSTARSSDNGSSTFRLHANFVERDKMTETLADEARATSLSLHFHLPLARGIPSDFASDGKRKSTRRRGESFRQRHGSRWRALSGGHRW